MNQVLQRNAFRNQNDSLKNKNGVIDLMHVSLKQIQMLMTFDKYIFFLITICDRVVLYVMYLCHKMMIMYCCEDYGLSL
jgi:hypothetical protein